jgi:peptidoglycan/LPS O-acetylase OafA/YrhL
VTELATEPASKSAAAKSAPEGFRPDIQGLRAIAVSLVVIYHLWPSLLPGGFSGVDVFFVISGYLITAHLWRTYRKTGRVSLLEFWGRRARRLVPAAALVLAVTFLAAWLVAPVTQLSAIGAQVRASALYFQNWQLASNAVNYLQADGPTSPVQHFWSLSVEEQFYIVWPLLFAIAALLAGMIAGGHSARHSRTARLSRTIGVAIAAVLTTALVAWSLGFSVHDTRTDPAAAYFVTTTRMWELGVGGLLALASARFTPASLWFTRVIGRQGWLAWAGLIAVIIAGFKLTGADPFPGWLASIPVFGAAALIACGSAEARFSTAWLMSLPPMIFLGDISYSLYLWHWPIINLYGDWRHKSAGLITGPALIIISVLLAWLTKVFVEDRVRKWPLLARNRWLSVSTVLAAVIPVTIVTVYLSAQKTWDGPLPVGYPGAAVLAGDVTQVPVKPLLPPLATVSNDMPTYWLDNCLANKDYARDKICVFGDTKHPVHTIAMVGDSEDGNWFPALEAVALQRHWKLVTDMHGSCAWTTVLLYNTTTNQPYTACQQWGVTALHDVLTKIKPDVVITSELPEDPPNDHRILDAKGYAEIGAGMATYWKRLLAHGIGVVAIRETPEFSTRRPDCVAEFGRSAARCAVPVGKAILPDPPTVYAARDTGGKVTVIDMNKYLCNAKVCPPIVGNVLVYLDGRHLTAAYALTTTPYLEPLLLKAAPELSR